MISRELLISGCEKHGIVIDSAAADRFDAFAKMLVDYNEKVNLTAITDPDGIVCKHFVDSLCLTKYVDLKDKRIIDVGTGAGFPGAALLCAYPETDITLIDSVNKKLDFIRFLVKELEAEGKIDCPCHSAKYDLRFCKEGIEVFCPECEASYVFNTESQSASADYIDIDSLYLKP